MTTFRALMLLVAFATIVAANSSSYGGFDSTTIGEVDFGYTMPSQSGHAATSDKATQADNATKATLSDVANALGSAASISAAQISKPTCPVGTVYDLASGQCLALASANLGVGSCDAGLTLIGGKTAKQCCDAGGNVVSGAGGTFLCKVSGSACPAGWASYQNWTTTASYHCTPFAWEPNNCWTGQHAFSNTPAESCTPCDPEGNCTAPCYAAIQERACQ